MELPENFELEWEGQTLFINILTMNGRKVFEVNFKDGRKKLFMSRSVIASGKKVWMSIPEGRQPEAIPIGKAIVEHFLNK